MPDFRYYDVFVPRGHGLKTKRLLENLRGTDVVSGPVRAGVADMVRIMSDLPAGEIERVLNMDLGEGMATVDEAEDAGEVEGGGKGPGGEKCHECGKPIQGEPAYLPVRRTSDPFEPFCQECAVKVHGVPREPGERFGPELEARRMRAKRIVFGEEGSESIGIIGKAEEVRRGISADDHSFCRAMLRRTMEGVRKQVSKECIEKAWGYMYSDRRTGEFQIPKCPEFPDGFYYSDQAHCMADIKAKGWDSALRDLERRAESGPAPGRGAKARRTAAIDPARLEYAFCDDWLIYAQDTESDDLYFVNTELWPEWADVPGYRVGEKMSVKKYMLPVAKRKWDRLLWEKA